MKRIKIISVFFLFTSYASAQKSASKRQIVHPYYPSSIIKTSDSTVRIDEKIIFYNKNLPAFISDLENSSLHVSNKLYGIPDFIHSFLLQLTSDKFTMADPGKDWNCCCDRNEKLPNRELICMGIDKNVFFINYLTGGIGETEHLILIRFKDKTITDFWTGTLMGHLYTKKSIIDYLMRNNGNLSSMAI